jgi:hypothetical protein
MMILTTHLQPSLLSSDVLDLLSEAEHKVQPRLFG